jgi:hypothetical protein
VEEEEEGEEEEEEELNELITIVCRIPLRGTDREWLTNYNHVF